MQIPSSCSSLSRHCQPEVRIHSFRPTNIEWYENKNKYLQRWIFDTLVVALFFSLLTSVLVYHFVYSIILIIIVAINIRVKEGGYLINKIPILSQGTRLVALLSVGGRDETSRRHCQVVDIAMPKDSGFWGRKPDNGNRSFIDQDLMFFSPSGGAE